MFASMSLFAWGQLGWMEIIIILGVGVILFGRRLPEVGRYLGKGIVEFKKGLKGIDDEIEDASNQTSSRPQYKFDPMTGKPIDPNATPPSAS